MEKVITVSELAKNAARIAKDVEETHAIYHVKDGVPAPRVESQLADLPAPAARRVARALLALEVAPRSGRQFPADSKLRGFYYKTVVVRTRRCCYRITYELVGTERWVRSIDPS